MVRAWEDCARSLLLLLLLAHRGQPPCQLRGRLTSPSRNPAGHAGACCVPKRRCCRRQLWRWEWDVAERLAVLAAHSPQQQGEGGSQAREASKSAAEEVRGAAAALQRTRVTRSELRAALAQTEPGQAPAHPPQTMRAPPLCTRPESNPQLLAERPGIFKGLSAAQSAAVLGAVTSPVFALTGGPGCGKTFTVRAIVNALLAQGESVALCAPTGAVVRACGCCWMPPHARRSALVTRLPLSIERCE